MKTNNDKAPKQNKKIPATPVPKKFPGRDDHPGKEIITNPGDTLPADSVDNSDSSRREEERNGVNNDKDRKLKDKNFTDSEVAAQKP